jgi:hypothetical protein
MKKGLYPTSHIIYGLGQNWRRKKMSSLVISDNIFRDYEKTKYKLNPFKLKGNIGSISTK